MATSTMSDPIELKPRALHVMGLSINQMPLKVLSAELNLFVPQMLELAEDLPPPGSGMGHLPRVTKAGFHA